MEDLGFVDLVCLIGVIPLILYLINKKVTIETNYILPFIFLMAFASLYEIIGTTFFQLRTIYWFRAYVFLEFYAVLYFYYKLLNYKKVFIVYGVLYFLVYLYLLVNWPNNKKGFNDLPLNVMVTLLVVFGSFLWFIDVFKKLEDKPLLKRIDFFYISSFLIYFCGTFLVFLMTDYLLNDAKYKIEEFWTLIIFFNLVLRITLIFTVWKARIKLEH